MSDVVIIGLGYIGLPTATILSLNGFTVSGVDKNPDIVNKVNNGEAHIIEKDLSNALREAIKSGNLRAYNKPQKAPVYVIVVPTPLSNNMEPDVSYIEDALLSISGGLNKNDLIIIESTSPVGITDLAKKILNKERPDLKDQILLAYCPERVLPGNTLEELINNDRVIGGINNSSTKAAVNFYEAFVKGQLHETDSKTAEMCKLVENSSRDVQIAFANELSIICEKHSIDVWKLIELANKHPRVNILKPGCGVGGHCIAVDPYFIVDSDPIESRLIRDARLVNDYKAKWCIEKIKSNVLKYELDHQKKPVVAMMGQSFKADIDDLRESPAKYITKRVISELDCKILVVEPNLQNVDYANIVDYIEAKDQADIIVYLVSHKEFEMSASDNTKIVLNFSGVKLTSDND